MRTSQAARGFVIACVLCFLAGHLAFLASFTEDIDSVNFVLGVNDFDVARHQPHPPGYPVFIALGKLSAQWFGGTGSSADAARGLALLSVLAGALAAWPLFRLLTAIEARQDVAMVATSVAIASPLHRRATRRGLESARETGHHAVEVHAQHESLIARHLPTI